MTFTLLSSSLAKLKAMVRCNGKFSFLDVAVIRRPSGMRQGKGCDMGNFLDFNCLHPAEHKRSVVHTLIERADSLPSTVKGV